MIKVLAASYFMSRIVPEFYTTDEFSWSYSAQVV
jgi:hypothetical protein